jgi:hypothetical protein
MSIQSVAIIFQKLLHEKFFLRGKLKKNIQGFTQSSRENNFPSHFFTFFSSFRLDFSVVFLCCSKNRLMRVLDRVPQLFAERAIFFRISAEFFSFLACFSHFYVTIIFRCFCALFISQVVEALNVGWKSFKLKIDFSDSTARKSRFFEVKIESSNPKDWSFFAVWFTCNFISWVVTGYE